MRIWVFVAAINGGLAVLLGAFAAHGLAGRVTPEAQGIFETGARYHMYHALALGLAGLLLRSAPSRRAEAAALLFLIGIVLFCGSLYALALGVPGLGLVTPIGGVAFLGGWFFLALAALRRT